MTSVILIPWCSGRLKLNHLLLLNLHPGIFLLAHYQSGWGKTSRHHSQHVPQVFVYYCLLTNWFLLLSLQTAIPMSEFSCPCANATLWDPNTRAAWGSINFCPGLTWFQVCAFMQTQWTALSQAGPWGEVEKPRWDMAFLMIAPSTNDGGDQFLSLAVVWVHPHQGHLPTLAEAAQKLMPLVDNGPDCHTHSFI